MKNQIKSFSIYGLFGTADVHIPFDEPIKILIGENGIGKTQVLNIFYYTLTGSFLHLNDFDFNKIVLNFYDSENIIIKKNEIDQLLQEINNTGVLERFINDFGYNNFYKICDGVNDDEDYIDIFLSEKLSTQKPLSDIRRRYNYTYTNPKNYFNPNNLATFSDWRYKISAKTKGINTMYFPTYRRVEEDLHNLGYNEDVIKLENENTLIQFGMSDVQSKFNQIEEEIDELLKQGISDFTKDILKIVMTKNETVDVSIFDRINDEDLEIIFSRAGSKLEEDLKQAVKETVRTKQFNNPLSGLLLQKLVELYEKQKIYDSAIKTFRDICNKYLINKSVFYDESDIRIYIKSNDTNTEIPLIKLSSGEKQIISIFSRIYLSDREKRFVVLFDEPELSLSMLWQKNLLPDIINSRKCDFLLAVTHSPFIFDNELDKYAVGMNEYITPSTNQNLVKA